MVNSYSHDIAVARIKHTFKTAKEVFLNHTKKPSYPGVVIALMGDMVSGNIHEELRESNEFTIFQSIIMLEQLLIDAITDYADTFGKVFVPCVVGNHGRLDKKPRAKGAVYDNFEWLLYQHLAKYFKNDGRVTFLIPNGPDAQFKIFNLNFLMTHGDQFRGGTGISGFFTPLMLGMYRKQKKQAAIARSFDVMMCGHFHQYIHTNILMVNGSIKGYDEYANRMNFPFERPQQAAFIVHRHNGMIFRTPILCDSYEGGYVESVTKNPGLTIFT